MTLHVSASLRDAMLDTEDFKHAMHNCVLKVYTGPQPATAEQPPSGTLLCIYSDNFLAVTREVQSQGNVQIFGASGFTSFLYVNNTELLNVAQQGNYFSTGNITTDRDNLIRRINDSPQNLDILASPSGADIILLTAKRGLGSVANGWNVNFDASNGISASFTNMGNVTSGVSGLNGLKWGDVVGGIISKISAQLWAGNAVASGIAGWFRFEASVLDPNTLDSTESIHRLDGAVANSGAELNLGNTNMTIGIPQIIGTFTAQLPTA